MLRTLFLSIALVVTVTACETFYPSPKRPTAHPITPEDVKSGVLTRPDGGRGAPCVTCHAEPEHE